MSSSQKDNSLGGLATITAVAVIGNPRSVPGSSKKLILDAQIYVGADGHCDSLLGALSFFNKTDVSFGPNDIAPFLIYANISLWHDTADIHHNSQSPRQYDFVGDIQWMLPLTRPCALEDVDESTFPMELTCHRAYVHVSGLATNCQKEKGTFDIDVEQYISTLKAGSGKSSKPMAPFTCIIPDSPRYKLGKPVPYNKRYASVCGFLNDVVYASGSTECVQRFVLEVGNVTFLGHHTSATGSTIPNTLDSPSKTPSRTGKGFLTYSRKAVAARAPSEPLLPTDSSEAEPTTPATPTLTEVATEPTSSQASLAAPVTPTPATGGARSRGAKRQRTADDDGTL